MSTNSNNKKTKNPRSAKRSTVSRKVTTTTSVVPRRKRRGRPGLGGRAQRVGPTMGLNYMATDGINSSRVVTNRSVIEDTFQVRREKIANVSGTSAFTIAQALYVNPGNTVLFPIFSQIAATYEEYRVNKCVFTFETDAYTATNGTASAGKVILATDFDPSDAQFAGDTQMENYCGSVKGPPYAPIIQHDLMMAGRGRRKGDFALNNNFVFSSANAAAPTGEVSKFYDVGLFQLATSGNAVTTEIGELYVTYSFTMIRPKQQTPLGQNLIAAHYGLSSGTVSASAPVANLTARTGNNLTLTLASTNITVPQAGRYLFLYGYTGTTVTTASTFGAGTGATAITWTQNGTSATNSALVSNTNFITYSVLDVVAGGIVTLTGGTFSGNTATDLVVIQISSGLALGGREVSRVEQLFLRVAQLESGGSRSCSSTVVTPFEDDFEESKLDQSIHLSRDSVRKILGVNSSGVIKLHQNDLIDSHITRK